VGSASSLKFKIATEEWEWEKIHRLNYKTFVEEIPQHAPGSSRRLVDKFHHENTYIICLDGKTLVGMAALRGNRPFSLDKKLSGLDSYLPANRRPCEIRLLAVEPEYRKGQVFYKLMEFLADTGKAQGYDLAVISGTTRQQKLYQHLGFVAFGPLVGTAEAAYQPMYLTLEDFEKKAKAFVASSVGNEALANFLPGPVGTHPAVRKAFTEAPVSHRSDSFMRDLAITKQLLKRLTGARYCEISLGSGTLANDIIAGQLSLLAQRGLVLSNGEFGERLMDHATRFGLDFKAYKTGWGEPFNETALLRLIKQHRPAWLWVVHCETSTGMLNDLATLKKIADEYRIKLCLDCISSIGTVPVNLHGVYLASGVSGKGLSSFPGLSMVFYNHTLTTAPKCLPRYLDLGFYQACGGVPFTHSSNLLQALQAALQRCSEGKFSELAELGAWLRGELRKLGFALISADELAAPAVATLALPASLNSCSVGKQLHKAGYLLSYGSEYLLERNWIQICLMGEFSRETLAELVRELGKLIRSVKRMPQDDGLRALRAG
jgi:aspartate aminotransferase-like enzyme/GNAT superfamily N-acetyltransferase